MLMTVKVMGNVEGGGGPLFEPMTIYMFMVNGFAIAHDGDDDDDDQMIHAPTRND